MKTFHYLPPAPEEQKAFVAQFLGTFVALSLVAAAWFFLHETRMRAILIGVGAGALYLLIQAAWKLEIKAQRSQNAEVVLDDNELRITNRKGQMQTIPIAEIESCETRGGRLVVVHKGNRALEVGARELFDGMKLVEELVLKWSGDKSKNGFQPPTNFIPLEPR